MKQGELGGSLKELGYKDDQVTIFSFLLIKRDIDFLFLSGIQVLDGAQGPPTNCSCVAAKNVLCVAVLSDVWL